MESQRGIIIVGNCRSGKAAMSLHALKHCVDIQIIESIEEVKKLNHHFETTVAAVNNFGANKLLVWEEKPQSKFISRPRHNFRKR